MILSKFGFRRPVVLKDNDGAPSGGPPTGDPVAPPAAPPAPAAAPPAPSDSITLTKAEYGQLMGTLAAMQAQLEAKPDADPTPAPDVTQIDKLTNSELLQLMMDQVNKQVGQPLLNNIMNLAVKEELREVKSSYKDFDTYKDDVYKEAQANTHLSLEQAYLIVKARKTGTAPPPPADPPAKEPPAPPVGHRPGPTGSTLSNQTGMSVGDAARAALKQLQYTD